MNTVLYVALGVGMLGFASLASAHGVEGEGKAWGKFNLGGISKVMLDSRTELKAEWKANHKDMTAEERAEFKAEMKEARKDNHAEFATFVGLSIEEIREAKKDGKTMGEILEDQGKDRGETEEFLEARAETKIEAAVERKDLNDEQEDNLRDRLYNFIQKLLDRWFGN